MTSGLADAAAAFAGADAVLIDLDGTLIDSTAAVERAWTAFAGRQGLEPEPVLRFAHGKPSRETVRALAPESAWAREAQLIETAEVGDTDGVIALPGAGRVLGTATRATIVTSCSRALAAARLAAAGLPTPELVVTSDDVAHGKPDPACFLLAAQRLGVRPARCVVLEDAPAGITAGLEAGMRVIAFPTTHAPAQIAAATWVVPSLEALLGGE